MASRDRATLRGDKSTPADVGFVYVPDSASKLTFEWVWRQFQKIQYALVPDSFGPIFVVPVSVATSVGTATGSVSDVQTVNDGNTYDVVETASGFDIRFTFASLERIRAIAVKVQYSGGATHIVEMQLYNYTTMTWDEFVIIADSNGQNYRYIEIPSYVDYLSDGAAILRFFHDTPATVGHDIYIDYVSLTE